MTGKRPGRKNTRFKELCPTSTFSYCRALPRRYRQSMGEIGGNRNKKETNVAVLRAGSLDSEGEK